MKRVFADAYYFFALLNKNEPSTRPRRDIADLFRGQLLTTCSTLTELADGMASWKWRRAFIALDDELIATPHVHVIPFSDELFRHWH